MKKQVTEKVVKDGEIVGGWEVGKLTITVQAVTDSITSKNIKGVFGTLDIKKPEDKKNTVLNFVFSLDSNKEFKKHVTALINEAITEHNKAVAKKVK